MEGAAVEVGASESAGLIQQIVSVKFNAIALQVVNDHLEIDFVQSRPPPRRASDAKAIYYFLNTAPQGQHTCLGNSYVYVRSSLKTCAGFVDWVWETVNGQ